jgi:hypothetical protein
MERQNQFCWGNLQKGMFAGNIFTPGDHLQLVMKFIHALKNPFYASARILWKALLQQAQLFKLDF